MALVIGNKKKLDYQETPVHHTLSPIVTGASTIGIFYKDGIMFGTILKKKTKNNQINKSREN